MITLTGFVHQYVKNLRHFRGDEWRGLCPFHNDEHNPNFYFNERLQSWYCFACGEGGGLVKFAARLWQVNEPEAYRRLKAENPEGFKPVSFYPSRRYHYKLLEEIEANLNTIITVINYVLEITPTTELYTYKQVFEEWLNEIDEQINQLKYEERRK